MSHSKNSPFCPEVGATIPRNQCDIVANLQVSGQCDIDAGLARPLLPATGQRRVPCRADTGSTLPNPRPIAEMWKI